MNLAQMLQKDKDSGKLAWTTVSQESPSPQVCCAAMLYYGVREIMWLSGKATQSTMLYFLFFTGLSKLALL